MDGPPTWYGKPSRDDSWLTPTEVAELLDVSRTSVYAMANDGRLPCTVAGGRRWFREDHIRSIAAAREWERRGRWTAG